MAVGNDRIGWVGVVAQAVILGMLLYVGWTVREIRRNAPAQESGTVLEWTVTRPGAAPVQITLVLRPGESRESWQLRLQEALQRVEDIR